MVLDCLSIHICSPDYGFAQLKLLKTGCTLLASDVDGLIESLYLPLYLHKRHVRWIVLTTMHHFDHGQIKKNCDIK